MPFGGGSVGGAGVRGDRWATPGSVNGVAALGSRHLAAAAAAAGGGAGAATGLGAGAGLGAPYQGMALLVVPQKPLPEVITPSDLRPDEKEQREIRIIRALLQSYLGIVKKNYTGASGAAEQAGARALVRELEAASSSPRLASFRPPLTPRPILARAPSHPLAPARACGADIVPKTVMCMLVNKVKDEIASELVHHLYAQITSVDVLLRETEDVASRRRELGDQLAVLHRGIAILNEIRDSAPGGAPLAPQPAAASATAPQPAPAPAAFSKSPPHFGAPAGASPGAESVSSSGSAYAPATFVQPLRSRAAGGGGLAGVGLSRGPG
jgi:hypothetical protein